MTPQSIGKRAVLVGAVVITAIIGAGGLIIAMQRLASIDAFRTATTNLGNGMAQQTTQSLGSVDRALRDIQARLATEGDATSAAVQASMRLKSTFDLLDDQGKRLAGVLSLSVADAGGRIINSSRPWPAAKGFVSGRDFFDHFSTGDDHAAFVSAPVKDAASGNWVAFLARRVDDSGGGFAGLVVAEISLIRLQEFYHLAMPGRRTVYVLRRDGVILVRYPPLDAEIGRKIPDRSPWYAMVAQGGGSYHAAEYFDAELIIGSVHPLRDLPFVVEASVTDANTLSEWYQQRLWVVFGCISSSAFAVLLLRLFTVQYRRLAVSEQALAAKNTELDTTHRQLDATLSNLSQGVAFYNADKQLVVYNQRYCQLYNLPAEAVRPGITLAEVIALRVARNTFTSDGTAGVTELVDATVGTGNPHDTIMELTDGRTIAVHLQPLPGRGWVATHEDITERRAAEAKIAFLARHDVLTGLANRALFQERLEQALALAERGKGFAVLCLDLDRFKAVNDTFGHPVGDALLRAVADRLRDAVRESDTIARLGGDEFAILQLGIDEASETAVLAERIVRSISAQFELDGHQISVGTSIGISLSPGDSSHPSQLMKNADLALYRSKQAGRGAWRFFEPAMDAAAQTRHALEVDLRSALPLGQFELHYHALVSSGRRRLVGFEALLRWRHPTRGIVPPVEFVVVAEEIGIIADVGAWVLQQACAEAATWPDHIRVAVNLSTRQFRGGALVRTVAEALQGSGISPRRLELEITESVPLQQEKAALAMLHDLQALGVLIALDDFGTGYSSLAYLRAFPFDAIKIDRRFVGDLGAPGKSAAIVRGIIGLATNLGMRVTAEGVETEAQFEFLVDAGCTDIQGFLFGKPVPAAELPVLIGLLSDPQPGDLVVGSPAAIMVEAAAN